MISSNTPLWQQLPALGVGANHSCGLRATDRCGQSVCPHLQLVKDQSRHRGGHVPTPMPCLRFMLRGRLQAMDNNWVVIAGLLLGRAMYFVYLSGWVIVVGLPLTFRPRAAVSGVAHPATARHAPPDAHRARPRAAV